MMMLAMPSIARAERYAARAPAFASRCAVRHGADGSGWEMGPALQPRVEQLTDVPVRWNLRQVGTLNTSGGKLVTASGLVVFGDDSGALAEANAVTGKRLWLSQSGASWRASPMAYQFEAGEMIAVAAGGKVIALALTADLATQHPRHARASLIA